MWEQKNFRDRWPEPRTRYREPSTKELPGTLPTAYAKQERHFSRNDLVMPHAEQQSMIGRPAPGRWRVIALCRWTLSRLTLGVWVLVAVGAGEAVAAERYEFTEVKMGAPFKLVFYADDEEAADRAAAAAFRRVDELNMIFSDYEPESELSRLSRASPTKEPIKLSDPLWEILVRAQSLSEASDGAFDVTVGPYVRLWRRARCGTRVARCGGAGQGARRGRISTPAARSERTHRCARCAGMLLDLGGIAMGYTVDEVLKVLAAQGIRQALVDGSGDIGVGDPPPGKAGWTIGIAPPSADTPPTRYVTLAHAAITTSGDVFQHVEIAGVRYSHIVDPKTGLGLTDRSSVTLIARRLPDGRQRHQSHRGRRAGKGIETGRGNSGRRSADPPRGRRHARNARVARLQSV